MTCKNEWAEGFMLFRLDFSAILKPRQHRQCEDNHECASYDPINSDTAFLCLCFLLCIAVLKLLFAKINLRKVSYLLTCTWSNWTNGKMFYVYQQIHLFI